MTIDDQQVAPEVPLTPMSLDTLLGRIHHEWETRKRIFDLPTARFWKPTEGVDLSIDFLGRPVATPIGPAAGPHSQMAQNIVLAWLGGARLFELKTVQVIDDLEIARPCIDMETVGYNIEWSQELSVAASLEEYVKAWMIIEILRNWEPLRPFVGDDPGRHVFDMSVGYDLVGIQSDKVAGFIDSMLDATAVIDRLRAEIPEPFAEFRDHYFSPRVADTITLSTFHGCPPEEIETIPRHLMERHGVDVIVKLNPTLLGFERVESILHGTLGYDEIQLLRSAFDADTQFERAIELIDGLDRYARAHHRRFGIKLTNTLVVGNHRSFMPDSPMYLSGAPLHVLATAVLDRLCAALPGRLAVPGHDGTIMVSFSAGVTKANLGDTLAMGVRPATICSDLLKPGGYGRLAPMLKSLTADVAALGDSLESFRAVRLAAATDEGFRDGAEAHLAFITGEGRDAYSRDGNSKPPRSVDHDLEMWGCVACNFCVTVCPNDAFFKLPTGDRELAGRQQYLVFSELCNECGNCLTFCPENGDPAQVKPRLYLDRERFDRATGSRFLIEHSDGVWAAQAAPESVGEVPTLVDLLNGLEGLPLTP